MLRVSDEQSAHPGTPNGRDSPEAPPAIVRDNVYYFNDGSCIIRVENTLFNVGVYFILLLFAQGGL
jgi:hypothetical protein